ncbi:MAG: TM0106 family RecB-like putative nuclease [Leucobacter sp.]
MFLQDRADGAGQRIVTSVSDLTAASACEFAFLRRVDAKLGREVEVPPDDDPMLARAARLGDAHEERTLARYRAELGEGTAGSPGGVVEIPRPGSMSEADLLAVAEQTRTALEGCAEVVFQATFFQPAQVPACALGDDVEGDRGAPASSRALDIGFVGFADFLRLGVDGSYEVQDTKLARRAKATALMQLAAYAEQLERLGVPVSPEAVLILGDGARSRHRIADIAPVFRARRERLHRLLLARVAAVGADGRRETAAPVAWGDAAVAVCGRCEVCEPEVRRRRDPLLIAGIRRAQRDALVAAGYETVDAVAAELPRLMSGELEIDGVKTPVLERLAWQAALQIEGEGAAVPPFRVIDPAALAALPAPDSGDLFFDFEGDPMYREPGEGETARWGLDYLFGMVDSAERFTPLWAHDLAAEKQALLDFLAFVAERRARFPGMHIYHYAPYERTHLLSIAARHGVGEAAVDELLREHVLVDLYPIVRRALRVGSRSYSIKKLEPLYMGDELRDETGVTSGAQSVTEYAEASAQLLSDDAAQRAEGQSRLDAIADYNRYDCVSTLRLRDWLLALAAEREVRPEPASDDTDYPPEPTETPFSVRLPESRVAVSLMAQAVATDQPRLRRAVALAASAIDYHEREQKSFWWAHFARLVDPIEDWADTRDVMVVDARASSVEAGWFRMPRGRVDRREVRLVGDIAPGSSFRPGAQIFAVYEHPAPFTVRGAAPGARAARLVTVIEVHDDGVTIGETLPQDAREYHVLPVALTPGPPPNAGAQKGAILEWGEDVIDALDRGAVPVDPAMDILIRSEPRLEASTGVSESGADSVTGPGSAVSVDIIDRVTSDVARLVRGTLPVQGPPGTGKTYLAAHVISRLVRERGWRIGVVAQSHKVVENVLRAVLDTGLERHRVAKSPQSRPRVQSSARDPRATDGSRSKEREPEYPFRPLRRGEHARYLDEHQGVGCVIGGTAWDFSNTDKIARRSLDLLVIDEAGQFSLAPTVASSVAAERLLLLGDPQQLPQVSQGSHPEPVDTSALGWLLGEHDTMPAELGYFLAETRRMRPELAAVVSELAYEGRLQAHLSASLRTCDGCGPAGLVWHPVAHAGNSTHSPEEAAEVVRTVQDLLSSGSVHHSEPAHEGGPKRHSASAPPGTVRAGSHGAGSHRAGSHRDESHRSPAGRPLTQRDLIVVAAYNAQVECVSEALAAAGLGEARVGTVDKFQGQEAVIAIVTLAASSPEDVPRGLDFLLMRNRLNVAISRAQWAAHLISSDRLGDGLPTTAEGLTAFSGYLRLLEQISSATARATVSATRAADQAEDAAAQ